MLIEIWAAGKSERKIRMKEFKIHMKNDSSSHAICRDQCQQQNITHAEIHSRNVLTLQLLRWLNYATN